MMLERSLYSLHLRLKIYGIFVPLFVCLHVVGGAAGAVSRITGTLGKGIAALTLDDEYQKKRREALNKRPANVGEGFARGGKGLVMVGVLIQFMWSRGSHVVGKGLSW
ncbi:hypothetical protein DPMN_028955 [Dreissena polymorpha]|uniref:Uncharacterized protein n=1 Tax=Dreissena polymorpha TaxID=45954 RepID=A0A9D4LY81_DREPO|nr:hypothetical protein DPMN_028955 [Dreissena polymorpha]